MNGVVVLENFHFANITENTGLGKNHQEMLNLGREFDE